MLTFSRSCKKWYRVSLDKYRRIVQAVAGLVPSVIAENDVSVIDDLDLYCDDLPRPLHFNEVFPWKRRWTATEASTRPDTIAKALKNVMMKRTHLYLFLLRTVNVLVVDSRATWVTFQPKLEKTKNSTLKKKVF